MSDLPLILAATRAACSPGSPGAVLATLVRARGSTFRRPGARMLITPDGRHDGAVTGGCLERDLIDRALALPPDAPPQLLTYNTGETGEAIVGYGMGCVGELAILLERLPPDREPGYLSALRDCLAREETVVLATIFAATDDLAARVGARLLFQGDAVIHADDGCHGQRSGFLSAESAVAGDHVTADGCHGQHSGVLPAESAVAGDQATKARRDASPLPTALLPTARAAFAEARSRTATLPTPSGQLEVFFEFLQPAPHLLIFGAGDLAAPLLHLAKTLFWRVTIADRRPDAADPRRFPAADSVLALPPELAPADLLARLPLTPRTAALILTHNFPHDLELLRLLLPSPVAYVGLLGARRRADELLSALAQDGLALTAAQLSRLHAPIGLDLGADTPPEFALAILAEVQAALSGRPATKLRDRPGPIHP